MGHKNFLKTKTGHPVESLRANVQLVAQTHECRPKRDIHLSFYSILLMSCFHTLKTLACEC